MDDVSDPRLKIVHRADGLTVVEDRQTRRRYTWPDGRAWHGRLPGEPAQISPPRHEPLPSQLSLF